MTQNNDDLFTIEHEEENFAHRFAMWFLSIFFWDGILPFVVVGVAFFSQLFLPEGLQTVLTVVVPLFCVFVRAHYATIQIETVCYGKQPFIRQLLLVLAIILALIFEWLTFAIQIADAKKGKADAIPPEEIHSMVVLACSLYLVYLFAIMVALRPAPHLKDEDDEEEHDDDEYDDEEEDSYEDSYYDHEYYDDEEDEEL